MSDDPNDPGREFQDAVSNHDRDAVFVIGNGAVTALAGGPISLADMGPRKTTRLSRVEFNAATNKWVVLDSGDRGLPPRFEHEDYDTCIAWETWFFNSLLAGNPGSPASRTEPYPD